ncbi:MAG: hypothetical protein LQ343_004965 [Gyalolechia ehrenbergii]|nr:MAG: hypothetical protein LQ343_004965 [Gyalolechia ehrenbergii]
MATSNIFILASDNSPQLLPVLRSNPSLASSQDNHGYSLLHATASYNHHDLLRTLVHEFHVDPNLKDEDGETPLFVVETVETAQTLVEELRCDPKQKNDEGMTAEEKIRSEGDFVAVADYLKEVRVEGHAETSSAIEENGNAQQEEQRPPPLPPNVTVNMGTTTEEEVPEEVDPVFRAKIEELAAREDFQDEEGQRRLRELVTEAVRGVERDAEGRDVRRRVG